MKHSRNHLITFSLLLTALAASTSWATDYQIYWGDIHCHSSYSDDAVQWWGNTIPASGAMDNARTNAHLDFVALTDHAEMLLLPEWLAIKQACENKNDPGNFVTLIGFEYTYSTDISALDTATGYGHKCVIFGDANVPTQPIGFRGGLNSASNAPALWDALTNYNCITIPHHPAKGQDTHEPDSPISMATDWNYVNASLQPIVEIYSVHGNSETAGCEEPVYDFLDDRSVDAALLRWTQAPHNNGYKLGIVGGTDNHTSHPGGVEEIPENVKETEGPYTGGIVAVMATAKTREAIFDALRNKRTYATSGPRIQMHFTATYGSQSLAMGETATYQGQYVPITLSVTAKGDTESIQKIRIVRNGTNFAEQTFSGITSNDTVTMTVTDSAPNGWAFYRAKVFQTPTPRVLSDYNTNTPVAMTTACERAWSSPIWIQGVTNAQPNDFDGDAKTDLMLYSPATAGWLIRLTADGTILSGAFGTPTQLPIAGDFDGDAKADLLLYDSASGAWLIRLTASGSILSGAFGGSGYTPVYGDLDGDSKTDILLYQEQTGNWLVRLTGSGSILSGTFGGQGYRPVAGDFDGDRKSDILLYNSFTTYWMIRLTSSGSVLSGAFGGSGYSTVSGDLDGDGKTDLMLYSQATGNWMIRLTASGNIFSGTFGGGAYEPVEGDFDGDGKSDVMLYDPTTGMWLIRLTVNGTILSGTFGGNGYDRVPLER